ncbi:MAG: hypothetical protein NVSMB9_26990 [Isosphaeraceae bacterium]
MRLSGPSAGLPILTDHAFGNRAGVTVTPPALFAETIAALSEAGYRGVDLDEWVRKGRPDEPQGFALTIDDGLRSILSVADVITRYRVPATVFLVAGRVGKSNSWRGQSHDVPRESLLSWSEIESLATTGFRFAAHGETHSRLDYLDPTQLTRELRGSREEIENRLGRPCPLLAYPYGHSSRRVRVEASQHFSAAFTMRLAYAEERQNSWALARIDAYYLKRRETLQTLIEGRANGWLRRRRVLRAVRHQIVSDFLMRKVG